MLIGILQCGHLPETIEAAHGAYDAMFARLLGGRGHDFRTWNVVDMEFPAGPGAADAWLVTGSRHGAYEDLPFIAPLEEFIRAVHAARVPMVGICFGHQIVAQALGGRVEKFAGGWALGPRRYRTDAGDLGLIAFHQDQVTRAPEAARTLWSNAFTEHAALTYGDRILTIQAHPEFDGAVTADLLEARAATLPAAVAEEAAAALRTAPLDREAAADLMARWLEGRGA